ncbi:MAG: hypothetical protein RR975_07635 [Clostridia bacterium]
MAAENTKKRIANCFISLVETTPPNQRVSVSTLVDALEIDRKTFYNHFEDINDLIRWIFRSSLQKMLEDKHFSPFCKVYPDPKLRDKYTLMPFYVRIIGTNRALHQGAYYKAFGYMLQNQREFYRRIFMSPFYQSLFDYMINLYVPALYDDLVWLLDGRKLPEAVMQFIAEYHTLGIFGRVSFRYTKTNQFMLQDDLEPFWNYAHIIMKLTLESYFDDPNNLNIFLNERAHYCNFQFKNQRPEIDKT